MSEKSKYIGVNEHPNGLDMPTGLSRRLAWEPEASVRFHSLSKEQQASIIRYIQNGPAGSDVEERISNAIEQLRQKNMTLI